MLQKKEKEIIKMKTGTSEAKNQISSINDEIYNMENDDEISDNIHDIFIEIMNS